jgi:hypothetical protein
MDREKVIKGLEQFRADLKPFCGNHADWERFDAGLSLLKEQEAVEPTWQQWKAYCGACGKRIPLKIGARFCHKCGKPISWEGR